LSLVFKVPGDPREGDLVVSDGNNASAFEVKHFDLAGNPERDFKPFNTHLRIQIRRGRNASGKTECLGQLLRYLRSLGELKSELKAQEQIDPEKSRLAESTTATTTAYLDTAWTSFVHHELAHTRLQASYTEGATTAAAVLDGVFHECAALVDETPVSKAVEPAGIERRYVFGLHRLDDRSRFRSAVTAPIEQAIHAVVDSPFGRLTRVSRSRYVIKGIASLVREREEPGELWRALAHSNEELAREIKLSFWTPPPPVKYAVELEGIPAAEEPSEALPVDGTDYQEVHSHVRDDLETIRILV
jgi:hypothetical protein